MDIASGIVLFDGFFVFLPLISASSDHFPDGCNAVYRCRFRGPLKKSIVRSRFGILFQPAFKYKNPGILCLQKREKKGQ
jgi:hypothetical protein